MTNILLYISDKTMLEAIITSDKIPSLTNRPI